MSTTGTTATWFKSSFSKEAANCVETRFTGNSVFVRDSKYLRDPGNDPDRQPTIEILLSRWDAFLTAAVEPGEPPRPDLPTIARDAFGVSVTTTETSLRFTPSEWAAFIAGVEVGEFAAA